MIVDGRYVRKGKRQAFEQAAGLQLPLGAPAQPGVVSNFMDGAKLVKFERSDGDIHAVKITVREHSDGHRNYDHMSYAEKPPQGNRRARIRTRLPLKTHRLRRLRGLTKVYLQAGATAT